MRLLAVGTITCTLLRRSEKTSRKIRFDRGLSELLLEYERINITEYLLLEGKLPLKESAGFEVSNGEVQVLAVADLRFL